MGLNPTAARGDLDAALRANHRVPGSVSDVNVSRLQARLELAEIRAPPVPPVSPSPAETPAGSGRESSR